LVTNGTRESLLFVNTNATYSVGLSIPKTLFPVGGTGSIWRWSPGSLAPGDRRSTLLPLTYAVPAEGILLLTNY
jgi:hypothetical protein